MLTDKLFLLLSKHHVIAYKFQYEFPLINPKNETSFQRLTLDLCPCFGLLERNKDLFYKTIKHTHNELNDKIANLLFFYRGVINTIMTM